MAETTEIKKEYHYTDYNKNDEKGRVAVYLDYDRGKGYKMYAFFETVNNRGFIGTEIFNNGYVGKWVVPCKRKSKKNEEIARKLFDENLDDMIQSVCNFKGVSLI